MPARQELHHHDRGESKDEPSEDAGEVVSSNAIRDGIRGETGKHEEEQR